MKNKGQALVLFIILIPVFIVVMAIIVDMVINSYNEKKFKSVSEEIVSKLLDNDFNNLENEDKIIEKLKEQASMLYIANEMETSNLVITIGYDDKITLFNTLEHYSFMNSLFSRGNGMKSISVEVTGFIEDENKIIEFKDGSNEN